jgi:Zn finger protein HypA/HybF involved in hydrogenase expression
VSRRKSDLEEIRVFCGLCNAYYVVPNEEELHCPECGTTMVLIREDNKKNHKKK